MGAALAHRGPDDQGVYRSGPVGLVQTRLSIIGLESGHQPMVSEDAGLALCANGEVYNYLELNAELRAQGRHIRTASDSESILHAYAVHGLDFAARLRGMFAFALHDAQAGRLILGRDRLGIKPLFYTRLAGSARLRLRAQGAARDPARTPGHRATRPASVPREPVRHGRGDAGLRDPPGAPGRAIGGGREPRDAPPALLVGPGCATPRARRATRRARSSTHS